MKPITVAFMIMAAAVTAKAGTELKLLKGAVQLQSIGTPLNVTSDDFADYVIQFKETIRATDQQALRAAGLKIRRYLPDDAYIVSGKFSSVQSFAQAHANVFAFAKYQADWKLSDDLPVISMYSLGRKSNVLVSAFSVEDRQRLEKQVVKIDSSTQVLNNDDRYLTLTIEQTKIPQLAQLPGVEFVQLMQKMQPLHMVFEGDSDFANSAEAPQAEPDYATLAGNESGTLVMRAEAAWAKGFHGENQIVGMADTGLDSGDANAMATDFQGGVTNGYVFGVGAKDWSDPMGHGTHVAGSVMGRGTVSGGRIKGIGYAARIIPQGMWSPIIDNLSVPPQLSKLFETAYADGARLHTNSWGAAANFGAYESMAQKVDDFMWNNPQMLILFAAGNSGVDKDKNGKIDANSVGTPGTAKNCLTVGASENVTKSGGIQNPISKLKVAQEKWSAEPIFSSFVSDNENGVAMFSSRGPTKDRRLKPDVVAPGTNILSNRSHIQDSSPLWGAYGDHYAWSGGTSMATPLTAGAAALVRQILQAEFKVAAPSGALVKALLMHTATDMFPGQYGEGSATQELARRPNNDEGYGRVNLQTVAELGKNTQVKDENEGLAQGEKKSYQVTVSSGGRFLANLAYTDAPGTPAAAQALVNNLDLVLIASDGKETASFDVINNHEIIELSGLSAGSYTLEVRGKSVPMGKNGKQPFALVFSAL